MGGMITKEEVQRMREECLNFSNRGMVDRESLNTRLLIDICSYLAEIAGYLKPKS